MRQRRAQPVQRYGAQEVLSPVGLVTCGRAGRRFGLVGVAQYGFGRVDAWLAPVVSGWIVDFVTGLLANRMTPFD